MIGSTHRLLGRAIFVLLLACGGTAYARVGGGESYGSSDFGSSSSGSDWGSSSSSGSDWGSSSSSGSDWGGSSSSSDFGSSSSSGSSTGGGGSMPPVVAAFMIGFFVLVGAGFFLISAVTNARKPDVSFDPSEHAAAPPRRKDNNKALREGVAALRKHDPGFSTFLLRDFASLLFTRFQEARGGGRFEPLRPYLDAPLYARLAGDADQVNEVVVASVLIESVRIHAERARVVLLIEAGLREVTGGQATRVHLTERWTLERSLSAMTPAPEKAVRLGCPSCGAAAETTPEGRCTFCSNVVNQGDFAWIVKRMQVQSRRVMERMLPAMDPGGVESGTRNMTIIQPDFAGRLRALSARDPDFSLAAFTRRVELAFRALQDAWTARDWSKARPYETDALFQTHRFWIERFLRDDLRNVMSDVTVERIVACRVEDDPWFDAITVRIFASMVDFTEDKRGNVVGGNPTAKRTFTEYWTFVRRAGARRPKTDDPTHCPSCGAVAEVDAAGICGACETHIAGGEFDWVASLIEQDDVYTG